MRIFIDGDFDSKKGSCEHHCSPSCHPAQIGPEWVYGCRHKAWPANRYGDFVPIVECNGDKTKCDMLGKKFLTNYKRGLKRRIDSTLRKLGVLQDEMAALGEK